MYKLLLGCLAVSALLPSCVHEPLDRETDEEKIEEKIGEKIGETVSAIIANPTQGGPFASYQTYKCTNQVGSYCYGAGNPAPELTANAAVISYMDSAARNWGCSDQSGLFNQTPSAVSGGFVKWYGVIGNGQACGSVYWNNARQAALFVANAERQCSATDCTTWPLNGTSNKLAARYSALSGPAGILGIPLSNPVPYGGVTTYQLFTKGVLTYKSGQASAFYAAGTGSRAVLINRYLGEFGASPTSGAAIDPLAKDIADTCIVAGQTACTAIDDTGDVIAYQDPYWGANSYFVVQSGSTAAFRVTAPFYSAWNNNLTPPIYTGGTPWSGSTYGFPTAEMTWLQNAANGQGIYLQTYTNGAIVWQPKNCPAFVPSCPSAGSTYCTTYGTRSTNYLASEAIATALCPP